MSDDGNKGLSKEELISAFEQNIAIHEDIVYGAALFFECLSLIHADQSGIVETDRKQFRNIIQEGTETTVQAKKILEETRKHPKNAHLLPQFDFASCKGHTNPAEMAGRCKKLVETYNRIFPDRPRDKAFVPEEIFQLIEEASSTLE